MKAQTVSGQAKELAYGYWVSQCLSVVSILGVADSLSDGSKTSEELATITGCNAGALYRLMRALSTLGVFREDSHGRFALTPLSEPLRTDVEGSVGAEVHHMLHPTNWDCWGQLLHSVRTGEAAFPKVFGQSAWAYRSNHPEIGAVFDRMAAEKMRQEHATLLDCLDLSGVTHVADVGGGNGAFLAELLRRHPGARGALLEMPNVAGAARDCALESGVTDRMDIVAGDFLQDVPAGCDVYLLKAILHNWSNDSAVAILKNCRRAMNDDGKILVIEMVLEPDSTSFANFLDLHMLVIHGGQQRTAHEFRNVFAAAGFELSSIVRSANGMSVLEGRPRGGM